MIVTQEHKLEKLRNEVFQLQLKYNNLYSKFHYNTEYPLDMIYKVVELYNTFTYKQLLYKEKILKHSIKNEKYE